jgi:hypothetical protein
MESAVIRAKELLSTVRHAALATVNEDGSPHNTPYRFLIDESLENVYWSSHPDSQHSKNIDRTGQVFIVLFETNKSGGLYIEATNSHKLSGSELVLALEVHNKYRIVEGKDPIDINYYVKGRQRMYGADVKQFWANYSIKNDQGLVEQDYRKVVTREELL